MTPDRLRASGLTEAEMKVIADESFKHSKTLVRPNSFTVFFPSHELS